MTLKSNFTMAEPPPETINFIGDSLVRSFGGKLFLDYNDGDRRVITQSRWRPYFRSSLFFSGNCFDDAMTRAFWDLKCIVRSRSNPSDIFTPLKLRIFDEVTEEMQFRANLEMPATIISCGGVEIWDIEEELYPHYSFEVEDAPELFELLPKYDSPNKLSYAEVSERLENRVQPLYAGMIEERRVLGYLIFFPVIYAIRSRLVTPRTVLNYVTAAAALCLFNAILYYMMVSSVEAVETMTSEASAMASLRQ